VLTADPTIRIIMLAPCRRADRHRAATCGYRSCCSTAPARRSRMGRVHSPSGSGDLRRQPGDPQAALAAAKALALSS
jgi:hypothetical protein